MPDNPYELPKMQFDGYLRLNGDDYYQSSLIEFANRNDYTTYRSQIYGAVPKGDGGGTGFYREQGLEFKLVHGAGVGTETLMFAMSGTASTLYPFNQHLIVPPIAASTSNTTNQGSAQLMLLSSVWDGTVAQNRPAILDTVQDVNASGNDATQDFRIRFFNHAKATENEKVYYPQTVFTISDVGKIYFGTNNYYVASPTGIVMDPSQTTDVRNVTWPDIAGGNVVVAPSGTVPTTSTDPGTPGTVMQDATHIYICYASGHWARVTRDSGW
jgi:hypothetical protein